MADVIEKATEEVLKGSEFIIKDSLPEDTFTPEDTDEEQNMIRDMVKDFTATQINPVYPDIEKQTY